MKIEHYVVGVVGTNCYFAVNEDTKECLIIDPGDNANMLAGKIAVGGYTPVAILLTHGHFDHIMGVEGLRAQFDIPVYVHEDDADMLERPELNACAMIGATVSLKADRTVKDDDILNLAGMEIHVMHTPGHTPGGCCYYIEDTFPLVFTGDSLFKGGIGRTDFPGGSAETLKHSLESRILKLPTTTTVYPGHGASTTVNAERDRVSP